MSISVIGTSQRSAVSTMHMLNPYQQIQAYGGFDRSLSSTLMYRSQWTPVVGNPRYLNFNMHLPVYFLNGGAGIILEQEDLGLESNSTVKLSYNLVYSTQAGLFSGGVSLGFTQKRLFQDDILTPQGVYEPGVLNHNDPILGLGVGSASRPTWSISGLWRKNNLTAGIQIDDFLAPSFPFDDITYEGKGIITLQADYRYLLADGVYLRPSAMIVSNLDLWQVNVGLSCNYGNIFGGINMRGFSSNTVESLGIISGISFNKHYTLAYSFDLGLSSLRNSTEGSHEIILKYNLNKIINTGLPPRIIYNPRDL